MSVILPTIYQAPEILEPGKTPLNLPALSIASQHAAILCLGTNTVDLVRRNQCDSMRSQGFIQRVAVVSLVAYQSLRQLFNKTFSQGRLHQSHRSEERRV